MGGEINICFIILGIDYNLVCKILCKDPRKDSPPCNLTFLGCLHNINMMVRIGKYHMIKVLYLCLTLTFTFITTIRKKMF